VGIDTYKLHLFSEINTVFAVIIAGSTASGSERQKNYLANSGPAPGVSYWFWKKNWTHFITTLFL